MFPLEFCGEVRHGKTRVMELPCGESCMVNRFGLIHQCDGQTSRRAIAYTRYSLYAVACKKTLPIIIIIIIIIIHKTNIRNSRWLFDVPEVLGTGSSSATKISKQQSNPHSLYDHILL